MKRIIISSILGVVFAIALGFGFLPSLEQKAYCDSCGSHGVAHAKKTYDKFNEECAKLVPDAQTAPKKCFEPATYDKIFPIMQSSAKGRGLLRGIDTVFITENRTDTLLALGRTQTYILGAPANRFTLGVLVKREEGEGGLLIKACTIDRDGKQTHQETSELKEGVKVVGLPLSILKGDIVQVEVTGVGKLFSKVKYNISFNKPN